MKKVFYLFLENSIQVYHVFWYDYSYSTSFWFILDPLCPYSNCMFSFITHWVVPVYMVLGCVLVHGQPSRGQMPSNSQLPIAPQLGVGLHKSFLSSWWDVDWLSILQQIKSPVLRMGYFLLELLTSEVPKTLKHCGYFQCLVTLQNLKLKTWLVKKPYIWVIEHGSMLWSTRPRVSQGSGKRDNVRDTRIWVHFRNE